ncbi:lysylphosphatidylglycerol synthase transmembrane domain-containing protein [Brachyspira sp. SAP_772]|uniref:lysylphosphatidylglycerol synthase transmembrane domain-containing protein n=1 Tax=Brachyspira sp. SAP_772 TaxID=2608385 RepID=UPI0012F4F6A2|nr:lysylphosphatidylglycerol synthase transmembrane domain-containing protein [Brachyspira sp. SAP_772]
MINKYIILAIILFFIGNIIKAFRTLYILNPYLNKPIKPYLKSTFIGFLIDFFFPFRVSDIARTFVFSRLTKSSWRMSLSLAFIERVFDLIIVFFILLFFNIKSLSILILFITATLIFVFCNFIILKKTYYYLSSLFNDFIKSFLLGLYWSLYRFRIDIIDNKKKLFVFSLSSLLMWIFNILSVIIVSNAIFNVDLKDLILHQFTDLTSAGLIKSLSIFKENDFINYISYLLIPNILLIIIAYIPFKEKEKTSSLKMIPYVSNDISLSFFKYYFNNKYSKNDDTYYNMTNNATIIKDLSAASEAKTYLMQGKDNLFVRKIALSNAADKLKAQYEWLEKNNNLPLPKILNKVEEENLFSYDMEYFANGETFFTTIHYIDVIEAWDIIKNIIDKLNDCYSNANYIGNKKNIIDNIYNEHILNNINYLLDSKYKYLTKYKYLVVNNTKVPNIMNMLNELKEFHYSLEHNIQYIHGDLTIENILVDNSKNYILIDPAPRYNNVFAEYAKLFQSLHGKYEYVKNLNTYSINENIITYPDYSTLKYERIFNYLKDYIRDKFGDKGLKSIYFYESICYIRAIVYMIKLNKSNAFLMLALAGLALNEFDTL